MAVAIQSFVGSVGGVDLHFQAGQSFADDHTAVRKWPHLFKPGGDVVESATAAPGEKRSLPARIKASVSKKAPKATARTAPKGKAMTTGQPTGKPMTTGDFAEKAGIPEPTLTPTENTSEPEPTPEPKVDSDAAKDDTDAKDK